MGLSVLRNRGDAYSDRNTAEATQVITVASSSYDFDGPAMAMGVEGTAVPGVYELGGPDVNTFRELMEQMLHVIRRRRLIVNIPFWLAGIMGGVLEVVQAVTLGLVRAQITRDQVTSLRSDNVVSGDAKGLKDLGINPVALEAVLADYLWRFRPDGQYSDIKDSASSLPGA